VVPETVSGIVFLSGGQSPEEATVNLDAINSYDIDGSVVSYSWSQISGPAVTLGGSATSTATFTAPSVGSDTLLNFQLTVTDDSGAIAIDDVLVLVAVPVDFPEGAVVPAGWVQSSSTPTFTVDSRAPFVEYVIIDNEQIDDLKIYNEQLEKLITSQKETITSINKQLGGVEETQRNIVPLMLDMVDVLDEGESLLIHI